MRNQGDNDPKIIKRREVVLQLHVQRVCPVLIHEALLKKDEFKGVSLRTIYRDIEHIEEDLAKEIKELGQGKLKKRLGNLMKRLLTSTAERQKFLWGVARAKETSNAAISAVSQVREEEKWMVQVMEKFGLVPANENPLIVNNINLPGAINARELHKKLSEEDLNELTRQLRKASDKLNCQPPED